MMMSHAPPAVAPMPVLMSDWEILVRLAFKRSKPPDLDTCPAPSSLRHFVVQLTNRNLLSFEAQTKKLSWWFWVSNHHTGAVGFEAQTEKPVPLVLRSNRRKSSPPVLRPNRRIPSEWFWGKTTNKLLTLIYRLNQKSCASRLHVHGTDRTRRHPTFRSSGHRVPDLCDHPRSSAPSLILLARSSSLPTMPRLPPAHNEASKHDSPHETNDKGKTMNYPRFEFKSHQVNDSSQSDQGTDHLVSQ
jgi:hypothetical protein